MQGYGMRGYNQSDADGAEDMSGAAALILCEGKEEPSAALCSRVGDSAPLPPKPHSPYPTGGEVNL